VNAVVQEPSTYKEASGVLEWQLAMSEELAALDRTGTWDIVPLPSHAVPITCMWVFKIKTSQMVPLSDIKLVLLLGVFNKLMEEIMMRLLLQLLI